MSTSVPETMTAIEYNGGGGPEVVRVATRPVPAPAVGEVLVRVAAAGVNRPDILQRAGGYPPPPGASDIPGLELAGEVVANGPDSDRLKAGDKVMALVSGGGYAEYCVVPVPQALPVPGTSPWSRRRPCRRPSSRSGPTSSSAAAWWPARRCWSTAAPAASARPRSSSPRPAAPRLRHRRQRRALPRLRGARRRARHQLPQRGLRRGRERGDRRARRRRHPRHGRRRLHRAQHQGAGDGGTHRLHRLPGRLEGRDRLPAR